MAIGQEGGESIEMPTGGVLRGELILVILGEDMTVGTFWEIHF